MDNLGAFWGLAGIPVITGLVQVAKVYFTDSRSWPIISLVLGIGLNVGIAVETGGSIGLGVVLGIVVGLASVGLWSVPKNVSGN